ncbi:hypothetical protein D3C75_1259500 [compost metagenome]
MSANPLLRVKPTNFGLTKIKPKVARLRLRHQENFVSMLGESSQVLFPCSVIANKIMGLRTKKTQNPWHDRAFFWRRPSKCLWDPTYTPFHAQC